MSNEKATEILSTLFVGGRKTAKNEIFISEAKINHIFNAAHEIDDNTLPCML
jgi:hypothetical protein